MSNKAVSSISDDVHAELKSEKSDILKTSELLLNELFWRRKTNLSERQIATFTTLDTIAQVFEIDFLKEWCKNYAEFLTSKKGQGRQDIVDIVKFNYAEKKQERDELLGILQKR